MYYLSSVRPSEVVTPYGRLKRNATIHGIEAEGLDDQQK